MVGSPSRGDLLITGARVVPVAGVPAPSRPVDLRVRDGRLVDVAPDLKPAPGEQVWRAGGRWAIPGLWDQHVHFTQWSRTRSRIDLVGCGDPGEVTRRVARWLAEHPAADRRTIIEGYGVRTAGWPRTATVDELDAVTGDRAVALISGDAHTGWLNSAALTRLGRPPRAGVLTELDWFGVAAELAGLAGDDDMDAVAAAANQAAARGVVGIVDLEFDGAHRCWPARVGAGLDQLRVRTGVYPEQLDEVLTAGLRTGMALPGGSGLVTLGPLKIITDGSLNTRTAFCCTPYRDDPAQGRGAPNYPSEQVTALSRRAVGAGLGLALHAIGDAAVAMVLDVFAATGARGSIEHAQLCTLADIDRMARLKVAASVQPAHLLDDRDVIATCWPDRGADCFALGSMLAAGVDVRLGSDAPVAPLEPWLAMAAAVHRGAPGEDAFHPEQALTPAQALAASTDGQSTLRVGSPADLVLLDDDPRCPGRDAETAARHLLAMPVAATFLAGRVTWQSP